jgi:hypothetical protein
VPDDEETSRVVMSVSSDVGRDAEVGRSSLVATLGWGPTPARRGGGGGSRGGISAQDEKPPDAWGTSDENGRVADEET